MFDKDANQGYEWYALRVEAQRSESLSGLTSAERKLSGSPALVFSTKIRQSKRGDTPSIDD